MRVLVIENYANCPVGLVGTELERLGCELTVLNVLERDANIPPSATSTFDGLVVLGGAMGAYDDHDYPNIPIVIELLSDFHRADKPIFSICLGAQMLARALGEPFKSNGALELGFIPLTVTAAGASDPIFEHVSPQWSPIEWHSDNFHIPSGAQLLMSGEACVNQAFKAGRVSYAFQFHPEIDGPGIQTMVDSLDDNYLEEIGADGRAALDTMIKEVPKQIDSACSAARQLVVNWHALLKV